MKKACLLISILVACIGLSIPILAQQEVGLGVTAQVSIGRGVSLNQAITPKAKVSLVQRHCQKYVTQKRYLLFWHKSVIDETACEADPSTFVADVPADDLVTNAGYDMAAKALSDTATQPASCNYFAFAIDSSNSGAGTVAITDTTIASSGTGSTELATNGLSRAQATFAHSNGTLTYTLTKAFSVTGTSTGVNKIGVFNASSSGTMCYELLFTPVTVNNGDTLTPTLTVTMSNP